MLIDEVIVIGTGRLACSCLGAVLARTKAVECFEPEESSFSNLRSMCAKNGVAYLCCTDRRILEAELSRRTAPTLVVSAYNSYIFPDRVLANPLLRIVNFHNSILPRHRGRNAPSWSIFEMDRTAGVTWHQVGAEIDRGVIIAQREFLLPGDITGINLTQTTLAVGAQVFEEVIESLLSGDYATHPPDRLDGETFHLSKDIPNDGLLDLKWSFDKAFAFLRALDYGKLKVFPTPRVIVLGQQLLIVGYSFARSTDIRRPALIVDTEKMAMEILWEGNVLSMSLGEKEETK